VQVDPGERANSLARRLRYALGDQPVPAFEHVPAALTLPRAPHRTRVTPSGRAHGH